MAKDNLDVVKQYVEYWNGGDFDIPMEDVDEAVKVDWSESHAPYSGTYDGHGGWRRLFAELRTSFERWEVDVHDYVVTGPYVAVYNTSHLVGRGDIEVTATSTLVFTFRDGKIVEARLFQEHADALKAIGAG